MSHERPASGQFFHPKNIVVGLATVIYAPAVGYQKAAWILPGGKRTDSETVALGAARAMNDLMLAHAKPEPEPVTASVRQATSCLELI